MLDRLEKIALRYKELEQEIASPGVVSNPKRLQEIAQERAQLETLVEKYNHFKKTKSELDATRDLLKEALDAELKTMAEAEMEELKSKLENWNCRSSWNYCPKTPTMSAISLWRSGLVQGETRLAYSLLIFSECILATPS
jgi:peptide chain release factor 1